jgi:DNA-directed RNA polymerase specialized sigma24 family protein
MSVQEASLGVEGGSARKCPVRELLNRGVPRKLTALAWRLTRDHASADDLVQETCLRGLAISHQLRNSDPETVVTWLARILRNLYLEDCRNGSRLTTIPLAFDWEVPSDIEEFDEREAAQRWADVLRQHLPPGLRGAMAAVLEVGLEADDVDHARVAVLLGADRHYARRTWQRLRSWVEENKDADWMIRLRDAVPGMMTRLHEQRLLGTGVTPEAVLEALLQFFAFGGCRCQLAAALGWTDCCCCSGLGCYNPCASCHRCWWGDGSGQCCCWCRSCYGRRFRKLLSSLRDVLGKG